MKKLITAILVMFTVFSAYAQAPVFLTKAEVETLAMGKKWNFVRVSDGHKIRWDLRTNGEHFANNYTVTGSDSGKWLVNDAGQICVKWRGRSVDGCRAIAKDGDKFMGFDSSDLKTVAFTNLTVE